MPEYKTEFKRWCIENGHKAKDIAEKTGIKKHTIYSYMEGRRYPNRNMLKRIEEAYHVNARDIFPL